MYWVDVLNRALAWPHADSPGPGGARVEAATVIPATALASLQRDVTLLRRVYASHYIGVKLTRGQTEAMNQWLAAVTLRFVPSADSGRGALRATRRRAPFPEPFEGSLSSALVQLIGIALETDLMTGIHRCHGVQRTPSAGEARGASPGAWPHDLEEHFARKARIRGLLVRAGLRQCPRLVVSERGSRYCSKACSNAAFAARKSHDDPRYFAHKQERYRRRKKLPSGDVTRPDRGAFVYMD